ncbi:MAG TPA: hypothetical protein VKA54_12595 [Gemmatimonadaceae bacterium]|nr:hypothetical protein [Gemmatimonadaceae bacterium]
MSGAAAVRPSTAPAATTINRWIPAAVFVTTLVVASVLLFIRVSTTTIELTGTFTGLGFVSAQPQPLGRPVRLTALGAAGVKDARFPEEVASEGSATALRVAVEATADTKEPGSIVVDRIVVPEGTRVWLARTDVPRQYRLSLHPPATAAIEVHADVTGAATFAPAGARPTTATLGAPRGVDFTSSGGTLDLDLTLAPGAPTPRWEQLVVRDLRVHRVDDQQAPQPLARPVSTIQSGSVYFEALGGAERKLRTGELLRFGSASGTILTLDLRDEGIASTFQGDVQEMRSGAGDAPRSLMPTLLEWLRKRQGLSLLWGTALYLSGIALTLRKWWRKPE